MKTPESPGIRDAIFWKEIAASAHELFAIAKYPFSSSETKSVFLPTSTFKALAGWSSKDREDVFGLKDDSLVIVVGCSTS